MCERSHCCQKPEILILNPEECSSEQMRAFLGGAHASPCAFPDRKNREALPHECE